MDKRILLFLILLAACTPGTQTERTYHTGTDGVDIAFVPQAPPSSVYEERTFPVTVELHNRGAGTIPDQEGRRGVLTVDYDEYYLSEEEPGEKRFVLRGKSELTPRGEETTEKVADFKALPLTGEIESPETQVYVSACYPYNTTFTEDICIDSTTQRNERSQVCEATDHSYSSGQGAPVSVTKLEVDMYPSGNYIRPRFVVHVENTGGGSVLKPTGQGPLHEVCSLKGEERDVNALGISAELADVALSCEPDPVRLQQGSNKVFCDVPTESLAENPRLFSDRDNFVSTLRLNLHYIYVNGVSKTMEIERRNPQGGETTPGSLGGCRSYETKQNGKCVPRCGSVYPGFSCSCDRNQCIDLGRDRCTSTGEDLCGPGRYCCQPKDCENIQGQAKCEAAGCTYNGTTCKGGGG